MRCPFPFSTTLNVPLVLENKKIRCSEEAHSTWRQLVLDIQKLEMETVKITISISS